MIGKLKFDTTMGLANNQLRAAGQEGEIEIARQLARAGILFVVECVYNIGGRSQRLGRAYIRERSVFC